MPRENEQQNQHLLEAPSVSLPQGGGAIKGIAEKFEVNAANGTASFQIPLPISPARNNFTPSLSLSYNSGSGNGSFGLGWGVSVPSILRKTDKGLPQYNDLEDSDVFLLSGAEDLVPMLQKNTNDILEEVITENGVEYRIRRYRPRIEGLFARIEKWRRLSDGDIHWRSISRDNTTTIYGQSNHARIVDPKDASRVFQWLIEFAYNDKGSCAAYAYKEENLQGVSQHDIWEKNRVSGLSPITSSYLKQVSYGNKLAFYAGDEQPKQWHFHLLFDYGEHDVSTPALEEVTAWSLRHDPFSQYRSGFEVRTYRRCQRVLMFHEFDELGRAPCLVKSVQFEYAQEQGFSFLTSAQQSGYIRQENGIYTSKSLPQFSFEYQKHAWNQAIHMVDASELKDAPVGLSQDYQWIDLFSEGLSGVLTEQAGAMYYKQNMGSGDFSAMQVVSPKPSYSGLASGALQLLDLESRGEKQLVSFQKEKSGFFALSDDEQWQPFTAFEAVPNIDFSDPNLKWLDIDGDGKADLFISEEHVFRWYPSKGKAGFDASRTIPKAIDEEKGPAIVFADATQSIYLANMSGSGMSDIVRIRNGEVCYWPNLGYGRFGAKVTMGGAPYFDHPDQYNPQYLRLGDIDGSGTMDIVYLGRDSYRIWLNDSGNFFTEEPRVIKPFPQVDSTSSVDLVDFLGTGTLCIVWSSPLPAHQGRALRYIDLMQGLKPHVLIRYDNGMGAETNWSYKCSTHYYLEDKKRGTPWVTKLPFPVQVVSKVEKTEHVTGLRFASEYSYHHGYYDHAEREFRGFGRVDQKDCESFEKFKDYDAANGQNAELNQPPVLTKTWFHTGAYLDRARILNQFTHEYYQNESLAEYQLPEPELPGGLSTAEWREALRAFKGQTLRTEIYALDGSNKAVHPYVTTQSNSRIQLIQEKSGNRFAVFLVTASESLSYHYERNPADPRISHSLVLETDELGNPLQSAEVVYPRRVIGGSLPVEVKQEQEKQYIVCSESSYTQDINEGGCYRLRVGYAQRSYEITGVSPANNGFFTPAELRQASENAALIPYEAEADGSLQKRLLKQSQTLFLKDDLSGALADAKQGKLGLPYETYQLAFTQGLVSSIYGDKVDDAMLREGGYVQLAGYDGWWLPSGRSLHPTEPKKHFYIPHGIVDPFGNETHVEFDAYNFLTTKVTDAIGNEVSAENDYRTLLPKRITDANMNRTEVETDALGMVVKSAVRGEKGSGEGDTLDDPTVTMEYDLFNWVKHGKPNYVYSKARETHANANTNWQYKYEYSDGFGNVVMAKAQAEPGIARKLGASGQVIEVDTGTELRWIGNGRTVLNNKGNPIKQYEPYFSVNSDYEDAAELVETGVSPILSYDAMGRNIRTDMPNGTFTKVEFDPWQQISWDVNDTVLESDWYAERGSPDAAAREPSNPEQRAAWLAAKHANTPAIVHLDSMGRSFYAIADNGDARKYVIRTIQDIESNPLSIIDDRGNAVMQYRYSMLPGGEDEGTPALYELSMDAGEKWGMLNILGNPIRSWDSRGHVFRSVFDTLNRPIESWMQEASGLELLVGKTIYGDSLSDAAIRNMNGQVLKAFDQAGMVESHVYDFKGNLLHGSRRLAIEYKTTVDWNVSDPDFLLESETFESFATFDALGRVITSTTPDGSVTINGYGERGALKRVEVSMKEKKVVTPLVQAIHDDEKKQRQEIVTPLVLDIRYDAKGQREKIHYGNDAVTKYSYDPDTFRLTRLLTTRNLNPKTLQDLNYTYDPTGNITEIRDNAQQTVFFNNCMIEPHTKYEYDALYRLTQAEGREHAGQNAQSGPADPEIMIIPAAGDDQALRRYTQKYAYDGVGNILSMKHQTGTGGWNRYYQYAMDSNRLLSTSRAGEVEQQIYVDVPEYGDIYTYNIHGSMTSMPHLPQMQWDFKEQLCEVDLGGGGTANYVYDASGQRVRKIVQTNGNLIKERIYLGGWEVYREHQNDVLIHERETLHVMDDKQRIALVDTKTVDASITLDEPVLLIRYQLGNHLGSASLELDEFAQIITYEEYHPYGTSAYQSGRSTEEVSQKRYRYTGMEKDEETGLNYCAARYNTAWLGRWLNPDPSGIVDGVNLYRLVRNNPILLVDPDGRYPGKYQKDFNEAMAELILASGNQKIIDRLLVPVGDTFKLNTNYYSGFNAGHTVSGDRVSDFQELAVELAKTNQRDGSMERLNPGMSKAAVEVDIGNEIMIPIERYTAHELELSGVLPAGSSDLPNATGWTRAELNEQLEAVRNGMAAPRIRALDRGRGVSADVLDAPRVKGARGLAKSIPSKYDDIIIAGIVMVGVGLYSSDAKAGALAGGSMIIPETLNSSSQHSLPVRMLRDAASYHPLVAMGETIQFISESADASWKWYTTPTIHVAEEMYLLSMEEINPEKAESYRELWQGDYLMWNGDKMVPNSWYYSAEKTGWSN